MLYLWIKAAHIIFVVAWMAGLLIYPRYKIHQLAAHPGEPLFERMKTASGQLRKIILTPALIAVWVLGLSMIVLSPGLLSQPWMHAKLLLVLGITALHGIFIGMGKKIDAGSDAITARKLRLLNELPFILMIGIVILVVVQPF